MLIQYAAGLLCLLGALLQYAAHRSPDIKDGTVRKAARRITVMSMVMAAAFLLGTDYTLSPIMCLIAALFASGQVLFAASNLLVAQEM